MIETLILRNLISDNDFMRTAIPFLKPEYFDEVHRYLFKRIGKYVAKYNKLPNQEALAIEVQNDETVHDSLYSEVMSKLDDLAPKEVQREWLLDQTEAWCKERAIMLAITQAVQIIDGKVPDKTTGSIPDIMRDAISICFDTSVGHDYFDNAEDRWAFYQLKEGRLPFDIEFLNKITQGGVPPKSLTVLMAGTGVGKSLAMCHMAAGHLSDMRNVLYISMEMAEERIAERIDANLMNVQVDKLKDLDSNSFAKKLEKIHKKTSGKLIIKEYPTSSAHVGHMRALLNDLKLKRDFEPDVIYIDYLNICTSSRLKNIGGAVNSYSLVKSIAEEVRGLAVEFNVPIITATQTNRGGQNNSDVGLEDTSESFGLPQTADLMLALMSNEEMEELGQIMCKQLKNRYGDPNVNKRFMIGIDKSRMKLFDVEQSAQTGLSGANQSEDTGPINRFGSNVDFSEFK